MTYVTTGEKTKQRNPNEIFQFTCMEHHKEHGQIATPQDYHSHLSIIGLIQNYFC